MKYLSNKPFSVALGESAAYRSGWDAAFGKKKAEKKQQAKAKTKKPASAP